MSQNPSARPTLSDPVTQMAVSQVPLGGADPHGPPPPPLPPAHDPLELRPDMLVGEYRITGRIGAGGMGTVYAAIHPLIGRQVAIKVLNHGGAGGAEASQRFLQEARAASLVRHRNIVDVFAFGQLHDGRSYLIMEFLEGENLGAHLQRRGPLSYQEALPLIEGICAGLKAAHQRGVVHRDLKPDNIWLCTAEDTLTPQGAAMSAAAVKLLDFGVAKLFEGADAMLTRAGMTVGTPAFMSPEQCRGDRELDHRSDLYSLGVILFELFAGHPPFACESPLEVMNHHLSTPPPSLQAELGMPPDLDAVIARALAKHPDDRFDHAADLWLALRGCTLAQDFTPQRQTTLSAPGAATRIAAPASAPASPEALPALHQEALVVTPRLAGATLTLVFSGEGEGAALAAALATYLGQVSQVLGEDVQRVVVDIRALDFLDSDGMSCLAEWLGFLGELRDQQGMAPTTLCYSEIATWQRHFMHRAQQVDAALRVEAAD